MERGCGRRPSRAPESCCGVTIWMSRGVERLTERTLSSQRRDSADAPGKFATADEDKSSPWEPICQLLRRPRGFLLGETSNVQLRTSNRLFDVGRSMFDVRRSDLKSVGPGYFRIHFDFRLLATVFRFPITVLSAQAPRHGVTPIRVRGGSEAELSNSLD